MLQSETFFLPKSAELQFLTYTEVFSCSSLGSTQSGLYSKQFSVLIRLLCGQPLEFFVWLVSVYSPSLL